MTSTIHAVLAALNTKWTAALPSGFQVGEGSLLETEDDFLIVAYVNPDSEQPSVVGVRERRGARMGGFRESYDITNVLSLWVGDVDPVDVRTRLFALLDDLDTVLVADPTLSVPKVTAATIGTFSFSPPISGAGSVATLIFTVQIEASP